MKSPRAPQRQGSVLRLFRLSTLSLGLLACGLFFAGPVYLIYLCATVSGDGDPGQSFWSVLILLTMGIAGFIGTLLYYDRSECPILSDAGGYPVVTACNCRNASAGRTPHGSVAVLLSL